MTRTLFGRKNISSLLLVALLATILPVPQTANAVEVEFTQLPGPVIVQESSSELDAKGCLVRPFNPEKALDVPPGMPYPVFGRDFSPDKVYLCTPEIRQDLTVLQGDVKPLPLIAIAGFALVAGSVAYGGVQYFLSAIGKKIIRELGKRVKIIYESRSQRDITHSKAGK